MPCLFGSETRPAIALKQTFSYAKAPQKASRSTLTLNERVAYQRAIEEVYWRHRIWPKENPGPKPSLDLVISRTGLEKKVEDYLRKSQLIAEQRDWPIATHELQAEVDRMARDTKQPELLRELFEALRNDPFVIAECLARPILLDRYFNSGACLTNTRKPLPNQNDDFAYTLPEISAVKVGANDTWTPTSNVNAPDVRYTHTAVWTGSEMIAWGGYNLQADTLNTGGRYTPCTDSWASTNTAGAPLDRGAHTAVWTGSEMIVWGGITDTHPAGPLNTGARYNPITDEWIATTATSNAPVARSHHSAVWTGSEMIVWGGRNNISWMDSGGRYNPETDTWRATSTINPPPARWDHAAIWTGSTMIVWGGTDQTNYLNTGGRYSPGTDSWTPTSLANVPPGRVNHAAIWTGSQMIVWGGTADQTFTDTNTGGSYNPSTDSWVATSLANAPTARASLTAVWTGSEMIVWGGNGSHDFNTGGRYYPGTNSWTPTTTLNAPMPRAEQTAVWTGNEMIVWGGFSYDTGYYVNSGGCYSAQRSPPTVQSAVSRKSQGNAGNFDVNLPLSGPSGIECRNGGATRDYTIVVTFLANVSMTANPQAAVTSGVGTIGSGGVSNGGMVMTSGNIVAIPLTNVINAQTLNVTLNNVNGSTNVVIPMRVLIGDANGNGAVNSSDVVDTKMCAGQTVNASNFRSDVDAGGAITATDVSVVKSQSGTALP